MPPIRVYAPEQQSYSIRGTASSYSRQSGYTDYNYTGTATPRTSPGASFTTGFAQGMAMGTIARANAEREEVFGACMMNLGWSDKPLSTVPTDTVQKEPQSTPKEQHLLLANSSAPVTSTGPVMISCGIFSDNRTPGKYLGSNNEFNYIIDNKLKTVKSSAGTAFTVRSWTENEIITDDKFQTFDTTPPISIYDIRIFNRVTGAYRTMGVWRTDQGKVVAGERLATIASKHPMWQAGLLGIWERRVANGDCRVVQKKF